jgi:hypothetical protein
MREVSARRPKTLSVDRKRPLGPLAQVDLHFADTDSMDAHEINRQMLQRPEVFPGWIETCRGLDAALAKALPGYVIADVKEKYGELRFHIDPPRRADGALACTENQLAKAHALIDDATRRARELCLSCGSARNHAGPCIMLDETRYGVSDSRPNRYRYMRRTAKGLEMITARHEEMLVAVTPQQALAWRSADIERQEIAAPTVFSPASSR